VTGLAVARAPPGGARARLREDGTARKEDENCHNWHDEQDSLYENPRSSDHLNLL
jgi:hypothetical protein